MAHRQFVKSGVIGVATGDAALGVNEVIEL
jgi:hypothetical protein